MSLATRQSVVLFTVIGGLLVRMTEDKMFSPMYMRKHVEATYKKTLNILDKWPKIGNDDVNSTWCVKWIDEWHSYIHTVEDYHNVAVYASICSRCLSDIQDQVRDPIKVKLAESLREDIDKITNFTDPDGARFDIFEKSDELMSELYRIIKWEWKTPKKKKMKKINKLEAANGMCLRN